MERQDLPGWLSEATIVNWINEWYKFRQFSQPEPAQLRASEGTGEEDNEMETESISGGGSTEANKRQKSGQQYYSPLPTPTIIPVVSGHV